MAQYDLLLTQNVHATLDEYTERFVNVAKGGLISAATDQTPTVLAGGTDGYILARDDLETTGLNWVDPATVVGPWTVSANVITPTVSGDDVRLGTTERLQFVDANTYIYGPAANTFRIAVGSSDALEISATGTTWYRPLVADSNETLGTASAFWGATYVQRLYIDATSNYIDVSTGDMIFTDGSNTDVTLSSLVGGGSSPWQVTSNLIEVATAGDDVRLSVNEVLQFNDATSYISGGGGTGAIYIYAGGSNNMHFAASSTVIYHPIVGQNNQDLGGTGSSEWFTNVYAGTYQFAATGYNINTSGTDMRFTDGSNTNITLSSLVAGGGGLTVGSDNQIPYSDSAGTNFDYSARFTFDGAELIVGNEITVTDSSGGDGFSIVNNGTSIVLTHVTATSVAGNTLGIYGQSNSSTTGADDAGYLYIRGGNQTGVGGGDGGNVYILGGSSIGGSTGRPYLGDGAAGALSLNEAESNIVGYNSTTGLLSYRSVTSMTVDVGTDNQIPYSNSSGNDFDYDTYFTFDGTDLTVGDTITVVRPAGTHGFSIENATGQVTLSHAVETSVSGSSTLIQGAFCSVTSAIYDAGSVKIAGGNQTASGGGDGGNVYIYGGQSVSGTTGRPYLGTGGAGALAQNGAETSLVAYNTTTGLLSYRTVASIQQTLAVGTDNQIPFVNADDDDFEYSSNFTWNGTILAITGGISVSTATVNFTGLGSDDTEDHVVAIDDSTGLLSKRSVASLGGGSTDIQMCVLNKTSSAAQDVGGTAGTVVWWSWDGQEQIDTADFTHSTVTNNTRLAVDTAGLYEIIFVGGVHQAGAGRTTMRPCYRVNGGTTLFKGGVRNYSRGSGYGNISVILHVILDLSAHDYVEVGTEVAVTEGTYTMYTDSSNSSGEIDDEEHTYIMKKLT